MDECGGGGAAEARAEVRLLSPVPVRRQDGTRVPDREWRTGKTLDLLRRLAVRSPHAVPVEDLLESFWPAADPERARASLRTAVSQLRRVLGADAVERRMTGLALVGVWVDASAFRTLADHAARAARAGDDAAALRAAREALALHVEPLRAVDDDAEWVRTERTALERLRSDLLLTAAEAALRRGWAVDALGLGRLAAAADPLCERACRVLAGALAALGEGDAALREVERCRREVAESTGAELSARTRALHIDLLRGPAPAADLPAVEHVGRAREERLLREVLDRPGGPHLVVLEGDLHSGRRRLLDECAGSHPVVVVGSDDDRADRVGPGTVLLVPHRSLSADRLVEAVVQRGAAGSPTAVVVLSEPGAPPCGPLPVRVDLHLVLHPLAPEDVADLAGEVLGGAPGRELVADLLERSAGRAGDVVGLARRWLRDGQVVSTSSGLVRACSAPVDGPAATALPTRLVQLLSEAELEVLQIAAVLGRPLTAELLRPLLVVGPPGSARASLASLVEQQLLVADSRGWSFKHPHLRDAVRCWMRPLARAALARRIAERADADAATRAELWLDAGEREMARAAALDAAAAATAEGDWTAARSALRSVVAAGGPDESSPADRVQLLERLADTCVVLHRVDDARDALQSAVEVAEGAALPAAAGLRAKLAVVSDASPRSEPDEQWVSSVFAAPGTPTGLVVQPLVEVPPPAVQRVQTVLHRSAHVAERSGDTALAVDTALQACRLVHLPTRDFRACRRAAHEVFALSADPAVRRRALFWEHLPDVLLGGAAHLQDAVDGAVGGVGAPDGDATRDHLSLLRLLVHHDLGRPGASALLDEQEAAVLAAPSRSAPVEGRAEVCARVAVERGELTRARRLLAAARPTADALPTTRQLRGLVEASLLRQTGRAAQAEQRLCRELAVAADTGCTLFVPEVVAKLVLLTADRDLPRALELFDRWDQVLDDGTSMPRETVLRLLARAAVRRAAGAEERASASRAAAVRAAREAGLVHLPASVWGGPVRQPGAHPAQRLDAPRTAVAG